MRLNLGCGDDIREGYVNVDFRKTHPSVVEMDLARLPWEFETGSADEILMLDFLEHFPYRETKRLLLECFRILKDDGELVVQVPDAAILASALVGIRVQCNRCGYWLYSENNPESYTFESCYRCGQNFLELKEAAMMRLFGGQDYDGNVHYTCFTRDTLAAKAEDCGFKCVADEEREHQAANWNFKLRFKKDDLW